MRQLVIAEDDDVHFSLAHPKRLGFVVTPLRGEDEKDDHHHYEVEKGEPPLKQAHESSTIQLFYDLFFVANLTTFTSVHEINDADTLKSYVGFFGVLWFTWFQVAIFDVRFGTDSVFERLCKALQFGIMTGFAVVGPGFTVGWSVGDPEAEKSLRAFKTLSLILMVSRLILLGQYSVVLFWLRGYKRVFVPIGIHMLVLFTAAMIFLGLFFSFTASSGDNALPAWYVTIGLESAIILLISGKYKFLSFRRTAIVERLGLLTLIILGEGVIGLCSSIQKVGSDHQFGSDIIGMIICGVVIIYCLWMLYFDQVETERVGTIRQQIWTLMHFPYHVAILLVVEGVTQLAVWRKLIDYIFPLQDQIMSNGPDPQNAVEVVGYLKETMKSFFEPFEEGLGGLVIQTPDLDPYYNNVTKAIQTQDQNLLEASKANILINGLNFAAQNFKIAPPEGTSNADPTAFFEGIFITFNTVVVYFFLASGIAVIMTAVLYLLGKRHKVRMDLFSIAFRVLVGIGLSLLVIMGLAPDNSQASENGAMYAIGPWMLPTVAIVYAVGESEILEECRSFRILSLTCRTFPGF